MTSKEYAENLKKTVEAVFSSPKGEEFMDLLEQICFYNLPTSVKGDHDSTIRNEGKREVVLTIKSIMKWPVDKIEEEIIKQLS